MVCLLEMAWRYPIHIWSFVLQGSVSLLWVKIGSTKTVLLVRSWVLAWFPHECLGAVTHVDSNVCYFTSVWIYYYKTFLVFCLGTLEGNGIILGGCGGCYPAVLCLSTKFLHVSFCCWQLRWCYHVPLLQLLCTSHLCGVPERLLWVSS